MVQICCTELQSLINPRPTGTRDFPPPTGGGGGGANTTPSISAPIGRREKRKKLSKVRRKWLRNYFIQIFYQVKIVASRGKKAQHFEFFAIAKQRYGKPSIISWTVIAMANPKTAFEKKIRNRWLSSDLT